MSPRRIPTLAFAADVIAVVVFAAVGRISHDEAESLSGLLATAAPFLIGLVAAWATPLVRAHPVGFRAGAVVLAGTAVLGLLLRAAFTVQLPPLVFVVITVVSLAVLLIGWRALSLLVSHRADQRAVR
ncbi:DUF3054 domain-containing protein [Pseudonocardia alaniniphila]|uniref:DUF3054 domain-containing protein n=1 Tax=Pseudonocardia alaniniphila TaxID=75291 RepID=A0ABS9TLJ8_9PSEU|nr:DUF3054 domain-containing protein [Pseudonocardia alaniniphila]MCH6169405.1 DUF3054 domain-containing protein [Pseudonocardia alaniniphila]